MRGPNVATTDLLSGWAGDALGLVLMAGLVLSWEVGDTGKPSRLAIPAGCFGEGSLGHQGRVVTSCGPHSLATECVGRSRRPRWPRRRQARRPWWPAPGCQLGSRGSTGEKMEVPAGVEIATQAAVRRRSGHSGR